MLSVPRLRASQLKSCDPDSMEQTNLGTFPQVPESKLMQWQFWLASSLSSHSSQLQKRLSKENIYATLPPPHLHVHTYRCRLKCRFRHKLSEWGRRNSRVRAGKELRNHLGLPPHLKKARTVAQRQGHVTCSWA